MRKNMVTALKTKRRGNLPLVVSLVQLMYIDVEEDVHIYKIFFVFFYILNIYLVISGN